MTRWEDGRKMVALGLRKSTIHQRGSICDGFPSISYEFLYHFLYKLTWEAHHLRHLVSSKIASDPDRYCSAFLGKETEEYCRWILNESSWGGAIELSILSEHFELEIAAYDVQTKRRDLHGEGRGYRKRCRVLMTESMN